MLLGLNPYSKKETIDDPNYSDFMNDFTYLPSMQTYPKPEELQDLFNFEFNKRGTCLNYIDATWRNARQIDNFNKFVYYPNRSHYLFWEKFRGNRGLLGKLECARLEDGKIKYGILYCQEKVRRKHYGSNELPEKEIKSVLKRFQENASDPILRILFLAAVVSLLMNAMVSLKMHGHNMQPDSRDSGLTEAATILLTIFFISIVDAVTGYRVEEDLQESKKKLKKRDVIVERDLRQMKIDVN